MTAEDRRRLRGRERRRRLIDAALVVLERDGLPGFSHRAVAAQAGVPLASATYHFDGVDDLAVSAILEAADAFARALGDRADRNSLAGYAAALVEELTTSRGRVIAGYELYLLAARRPALRPAAQRWLRAGTDALLADTDELRRRSFLAAVNAVCLDALLGDAPPQAADAERLLARALE